MNDGSTDASPDRLPGLLRKVADELRTEDYPYPDLPRFAAVQRVSQSAGLDEREGAALISAARAAQREADAAILVNHAAELERSLVVKP
jgi:hypothetical protein